MKNFLLGIILASACGSYAQAGRDNLKQERFEIQYIKNDYSLQILRINGSLIVGHGESQKTLLNFIDNNLRSGVDIHIYLRMFGGDLALVNKVFKKIRNKCHTKRYSRCEITTEIEMFRHCASACIPLFMVGDKRIAGERTNWGFHQAATLGGYLKIPFMAEYVLRSKGVSQTWLKRNKKLFKGLKMTWLSPNDLSGSRIITHLKKLPN